ncbi:MAG: FAD-dependent oxidoreductase [Lentisphaerae bacterium]|nr:FAD-dependent oxidoreductase [Lentisphaerota bacterium]
MNLSVTPRISDYEYDVLVCGSGMGGITAAVAAAQNGLKAGIIEYFGEPGGIPVSGRLGSISGFSRLNEVAVAGFARSFANELLKRELAHEQGGGSNINLTPPALSGFIFEILDFYNIDFHSYTQLISCAAENGRITHAIVANKAGVTAIPAKIFIDATGDGDLAVMAGCPFEKGRKSDGKVQSSTLVFVMGGIDLERLPAYLDVRKVWKSVERPVPIDHSVFQFVPHGSSTNEVAVNMTHVLNCDCTVPEDLTRIRKEAVKQAEYLVYEFFRKEIPGCEKAWISHYAPQIGCRETRRILGDYYLTEDDVKNYRHFEDDIAQGIWAIDIHTPDGIHRGCGHKIEKPYGIPYRCITPQGIDNLYIAGRPISVDHIAHSSTRINASCMALGEAAGVAAKAAIAAGSTRKIDIAELQQKIAAMKYDVFNH